MKKLEDKKSNHNVLDLLPLDQPILSKRRYNRPLNSPEGHPFQPALNFQVGVQAYYSVIRITDSSLSHCSALEWMGKHPIRSLKEKFIIQIQQLHFKIRRFIKTCLSGRFSILRFKMSAV